MESERSFLTDGVKPYNILILFGSLAYMAITLDITGVLQAAAFWVSNKGKSNPRRLFTYFYLMLLALSIVVGNDPVILSGTAFLAYYTDAAQIDHTAWVMSEFAVANTASMVLFLGNPTNVVICEGFGVNNVAFTAYTILPFVACALASYVILALQFWRPKYLPKEMPIKGVLDASKVFHDPKGAVVGSILLGSCLVVIIVVSFFKVDVWKITLPFAVAKFLFDLAWDDYRYRRKILPNYLEDEREEIKRAFSVGSITDLDQTMAANGMFGPHTAEPKSILGMLDANNDKLPNGNGKALKEDILPTWYQIRYKAFESHFPTLAIALPRLPFALIPFAFSQFILIEALSHQGWIEVFSHWLMKATGGGKIHPMIWIVGVFGVILCNIAGTNIGATILLTKIVHAAPGISPESTRAAAIALAVASNIGAVSFTFSASLAGLLWQTILKQKGKSISQWTFARLNFAPLVAMTLVGLGVVSAEMAVLYR